MTPDANQVWKGLTNSVGEIPAVEVRPATDDLPSLGHEDIGWDEDGNYDENMVALHARVVVGGDQLLALCPHISDGFNYNLEIARAIAAAGQHIKPTVNEPAWTKNAPDPVGTYGEYWWYHPLEEFASSPEPQIVLVRCFRGAVKAFYLAGAVRKVSEMRGEWCGPIMPPNIPMPVTWGSAPGVSDDAVSSQNQHGSQ